VRNGSLRALAVSSEQRLKGTLAQVPTWKEQGVNAVFTSVQGVYFPKDLGAAQIAFWDTQFQAMAASPEWLHTLAQYEVTPRFMNHAQANAYVRNEISSATALLRELKLLK
jgi:putative tricarboxylic transport membrane protein